MRDIVVTGQVGEPSMWTTTAMIENVGTGTVTIDVAALEEDYEKTGQRARPSNRDDHTRARRRKRVEEVSGVQDAVCTNDHQGRWRGPHAPVAQETSGVETVKVESPELTDLNFSSALLIVGRPNGHSSLVASVVPLRGLKNLIYQLCLCVNGNCTA